MKKWEVHFHSVPAKKGFGMSEESKKMIKVAIAEDDFRIAQVQEQFLQKLTG